jgi:hypothetical protein
MVNQFYKWLAAAWDRHNSELHYFAHVNFCENRAGYIVQYLGN